MRQRRVYGADHDDPDPGPKAGHEYRELVGGPLDGLLVDVTGWSDAALREGARLITEIGALRSWRPGRVQAQAGRTFEVGLAW